MASLQWLPQGWGYEITGIDVVSAYDHAMKAAAKIGPEERVCKDIMNIVEQGKSPGIFVKNLSVCCEPYRNLDRRKR